MTVLHILCGKIASGKSSFAARLGQAPGTVVLGEDALLSGLYGPQMQTLPDYMRYSARLRAAIEGHVVALLRNGCSVVLDFAANTPDTRAWMRSIIDAADCDHALHFLDVPDEVCRARLKARNAAGTHPFQVDDEQFDWITAHFVTPTVEEGFEIRTYPFENRS
ncbi:AAA family ATPase [Shimia sp.]|uniref:AAA family ATPase n=1 Tax=Shimia sp. TaxID=1954381 RepID=UPI003569E7EE